jgi:D-alanyl-D-alanine carboxypeptidase
MILKNVTQSILLFFVFILFLGFIIYISQQLLGQNKNLAMADVSEVVNNFQEIKKDNQNMPQRDWQIKNLDISAKSAISLETDLLDENKILFSKNSELKLPIASLTKLMTAVIVLDNYNLSDNIYISNKANAMDSVISDIKTGDNFSVENLLYIMLIESSNKSAYALSEKIGEPKFIQMMNQKAKSIGLNNTFFSEPTGLSNENYSTADDLAKLAEYIVKNYPEIIDISRIKEFELPNFTKILNTNQLLDEIPDIIGGKTGFTTDAKGCLLLLINNTKAKDYLIYVVLGSDNRFDEMKNIINWTNAAYKWQ